MMQKRDGFVILYVLLGLFLLVSIALTTAYVRYQAAFAARERGQANLAEASIATGKPWLTKALYRLTLELRPGIESRTTASPPYLGVASLAAIASDAQNIADRYLCNKAFGDLELRVFFLDKACGETAPATFTPQWRRLPTRGLEAYAIDFLALVRAQVGDAQRTAIAPGTLTIYVGQATPAQFQLFAMTGYQSDGTPSPFRAEGIWNGRVYVAGVPIFGTGSPATPGPVFLGPFFTGRCRAVSPTGCPGGQGDVEFVDVGAIPPEELYPSPFNPCYGPACPKFAGGVEWNAPAMWFDWNASADRTFDATGGARVYLEATSSNTTRVEVTTSAGTQRIVVRPGQRRIIRFTGGEVHVLGPPSSPAWSTYTSLTIVAEKDLIIEGNLFSENPPCRSPAGFIDGIAQPPDCPGGAGSGVLGLVSEGGDILVSTTTPADLYLHAAILAPKGSFRPQSMPTDRRSLTLMGSIAIKHFDSFFRNGKGWVMRLAYDPRLDRLSPPGWPRLPETGDVPVWGIIPTFSWGSLR